MSMDEKNPKDLVSSAASDHDASSSGSVDGAWKFLNDHREAGGDTSSVDINALRRKIDWHIVPLMFGCYTMQFLDKVILNYAAVMGLNKDLKLVGNDFSNIATFLFSTSSR
ncbi:major facilitator superfamily transporter [Colletotrichum gloeosporioides Cg-14]|uniref:Major facilitator superfamily transporter n=1 Tax=Colletotrichum gloeosporioides (strain Cg-14) TaxID=1237896 RepID=T0KXU7_COLGC|nr:major facilitator superfamily transporter [Colletotrichum gloeosporioides Cg-14]